MRVKTQCTLFGKNNLYMLRITVEGIFLLNMFIKNNLNIFIKFNNFYYDNCFRSFLPFPVGSRKLMHLVMNNVSTLLGNYKYHY